MRTPPAGDRGRFLVPAPTRDRLGRMNEPADLLATRVAYDTVAVDYEALLRDELAVRRPDDREKTDQAIVVARRTEETAGS